MSEQREIIYSAEDLFPGDVIVYPQSSSSRRDVLCVVRTASSGNNSGTVYVHRVYPKAWERGVEFTVVPKQMEAGVRLQAPAMDSTEEESDISLYTLPPSQSQQREDAC